MMSTRWCQSPTDFQSGTTFHQAASGLTVLLVASTTPQHTSWLPAAHTPCSRAMHTTSPTGRSVKQCTNSFRMHWSVSYIRRRPPKRPRDPHWVPRCRTTRHKPHKKRAVWHQFSLLSVSNEITRGPSSGSSTTQAVTSAKGSTRQWMREVGREMEWIFVVFVFGFALSPGN